MWSLKKINKDEVKGMRILRGNELSVRNNHRKQMLRKQWQEKWMPIQKVWEEYKEPKGMSGEIIRKSENEQNSLKSNI